jgi:iron complex transport system substrate-binding protein
VEVWIANHRSVAGILAYIRRLGALVGVHEPAERYARDLEARIDRAREAAARLPGRPRVYFEEWDQPLICGIRWVSELVEIAGGRDIFADRSSSSLAQGRIVSNPDDVIDADPDLIIGSWCGKKFRPEQVAARPGWPRITAVRDGELHEIKSPLILQPGPAALTDGLDALQAIVARWASRSEPLSQRRQ